MIDSGTCQLIDSQVLRLDRTGQAAAHNALPGATLPLMPAHGVANVRMGQPEVRALTEQNGPSRSLLRHHLAVWSFKMSSDIFSAIMIVVRFMLAHGMLGITEASTTRRPSTP